MQPFDFALGLGRGRVAQGDLIETEGGAELGEGVGLMGEEERVVIDIEGQRQTAGEKSAGEKVEMGQKSLARIEPRQRDQAAVIIDDIEQGKLLVALWQTSDEAKYRIAKVDRSAEPASDGPAARPLVFGVGSKPCARPSAARGAIEFEAVAAVDFGGGETVGTAGRV